MARIARIVIPNIPHHVTQRGNRKLPTFFSPEDFQEYKKLLLNAAVKHGIKIWAYCLMTNHIHLIGVPLFEDSLRLTLAETHQRYTRYIHFRTGWRGYLWQGRFSSFPMDETYTLRAARYIELNPVAAKIVTNPEDYAWSSARAHVLQKPDFLIQDTPLLQRMEGWKRFLKEGIEELELKQLEKHERTGRPLGNTGFIRSLEQTTGRKLTPNKAGPKPRQYELSSVSPD